MVDYPDFNAESLRAWEANAEFWDQAQGDEGNYWQRTSVLVFPHTRVTANSSARPNGLRATRSSGFAST